MGKAPVTERSGAASPFAPTARTAAPRAAGARARGGHNFLSMIYHGLIAECSGR